MPSQPNVPCAVPLASIALAFVALAGCNEPAGPASLAESYAEISFELDGRAYQGAHVSGSLQEGAFHVTASDYVGFGHLMFWVNDWSGLGGSFDVAGSGGRRGVEYLPSDQVPSAATGRFSTARHGGSGRITLDSAPDCETVTGSDPGLGMSGRTVYCTLAGSFSFTARNCHGEEVRITGGRFQVTLERAETRLDPGPFGDGGGGTVPGGDPDCPTP